MSSLCHQQKPTGNLAKFVKLHLEVFGVLDEERLRSDCDRKITGYLATWGCVATRDKAALAARGDVAVNEIPPFRAFLRMQKKERGCNAKRAVHLIPGVNCFPLALLCSLHPI